MKNQHKLLSVLLICALLSVSTASVACADTAPLIMPILQSPIHQAVRPVQTTVLTPTASGKSVKSGPSAAIDYSNCNEGYIMAKYTGSCPKVKLQITGSNKVTYTYVLKSGGYQTFPLTSGDGNYTVNVFENVSGNQYALALGHTVSVKLRSSVLPYLYPNQYVDFNSKSATVAKGAELAANAADEIAVVTNVYNYVTSNITYDEQKALTVTSGYLPVVDTILSTNKGICFDYAAVMATMLRSQNIPTRLEVGYVSGGVYHAWVSVYLTNIGWVNGAIYFDGINWKLMDPTFASNGKSGSSIMKFIGDGSNYSTKYVY